MVRVNVKVKVMVRVRVKVMVMVKVRVKVMVKVMVRVRVRVRVMVRVRVRVKVMVMVKVMVKEEEMTTFNDFDSHIENPRKQYANVAYVCSKCSAEWFVEGIFEYGTFEPFDLDTANICPECGFENKD